MLTPYTKRIAYVHYDEIVEVGRSPDLPFAKDELLFDSGEAKEPSVLTRSERRGR